MCVCVCSPVLCVKLKINVCVSSFVFAAGLGLDDEDPDDDDVFEPVTEAPKKVVKASVKRRSQSLSALKDKEESKALRKVG